MRPIRIRQNEPQAVSRPRGCSLLPVEWDAIAQVLSLTQREVQIVQALFEGGHEQEIGPALGISSHTVHTHLGRIYRKLDVHSLPELLLRVFCVYVESVRPAPAPALREAKTKSATGLFR